METFEVIKNYIINNVDNPPDNLTPESKLNELGLDSLAILELMFEIEDKYNITLPDNAQKPETVGQLIKLIEELMPSITNG